MVLEMNVLVKMETQKAFVFLRDDGIMQIDTKDAEEFTINDMKEIIHIIGEIGNYKKYPILMVIKNFTNVDKAARAYCAGVEGNKYTLADAFVIQSFAMKLIGNFYLKFDQPLSPSKMFNRMEEAETWLKKFIDAND
jgi:uroporphyrinogen-III decarboxylase